MNSSTSNRHVTFGSTNVQATSQLARQAAEQRNIGRISGILRLGLRLAAFSPLVLICLLAAGTAQAGSWEYQAEQWDAQGNYDQAIAAYTQAIAFNPTDSTAYNNRGWDWWKKGELDKALSDYNQALALCPTSAATYTNRGVVWDDKGEHDRAMADFQQAIALDPTISDSYNNRGTIESSTGKFEQAKNDFYRALSINANSTAGLENLAFFQATCPDANYRDGKKAFDERQPGLPVRRRRRIRSKPTCRWPRRMPNLATSTRR